MMALMFACGFLFGIMATLGVAAVIGGSQTDLSPRYYRGDVPLDDVPPRMRGVK